MRNLNLKQTLLLYWWIVRAMAEGGFFNQVG